MKMNVENKLDKVVNILKEKGFVVYRKGGKEPEYVECQIVRKETGDEQRKTMKLSLNINDDDNDDVFFVTAMG